MTINAIDLLPVRTESCPVMGDYAIKKHMTVPYSKAKKGDVVLYDFNRNGTSDHTGIIFKVDGSKLYVVEGNTGSDNCNGGAVLKRSRVKSQVNYIVRPKYNKTVTADMVVDTALSQVGVKESPKNSNNVKYNTWYYGHPVHGDDYSWCMTFVQWCFAHVKEPETKKKPAPKGAYSGSIPKPTLKKGSKGAEVTKLQKFFEWYYPGVKFKKYGAFGEHTKKVQKRFQREHGLKQTGIYGASSYKKASAYKSKQKTTNADKLIAEMKKLAWPYGTPEKKYDYKTGAPTAACKKAMKKYGWADDRAEMSDCGNFVSTGVRASGVDNDFKALHGVKTPFPKKEDAFDIVLSGKAIPKGFLKAGDVIRYKKTNGKQHTMLYFGPGKVCEASHYNVFGVIRKDTKRYNTQSKKSTIQVLRAKE